MTTRPPLQPADEPARSHVLDADILAQLDAAMTPEPLDAQAHARIKTRLLRRLASEGTPRHLTRHADSNDWQRFGHGLSMKVLHEAGGIMSYLVRLAPGAQLPGHRHPVDEECVVLEGAVQIGDLHVDAGGFHLGRKDVLHDVLRSEDGAVIYLRGAVPEISLVI